MPNRWTFKVVPLLDIVLRYKSGRWFDPFAGFHSPAEVTNDLNHLAPTKYHLDALDFVSGLRGRYAGAIMDPPYSLTQVSRSYKNLGLKFKGKENPTGGFPKVKDRVADLVISGGYVVSFGWNSCGIGLKRGFDIVEVLLCCHGGNRNDTIAVVERKR